MKYIANLQDNHYVIWDTSYDAPITPIKSFKDMETFLRENYNKEPFQLDQFIAKLNKAKTQGVSTQLVVSDQAPDQVEALLENNRAGLADEEISLPEILSNYSKLEFFEEKYNFLKKV